MSPFFSAPWVWNASFPAMDDKIFASSSSGIPMATGLVSMVMELVSASSGGRWVGMVTGTTLVPMATSSTKALMSERSPSMVLRIVVAAPMPSDVAFSRCSSL